MAKDKEKTPEEIASEAEAAEAEAKAVKIEGDFDPERAARTIAAQRASEEKLKAENAALKAEKSEREEAEADAERSLEEKLNKRDDEIKSLKAQIANGAIKTDFERKAAEAGVQPDAVELAYLAAEKEDLLGSADPKTGVVGNHDFEKLAEIHPALFEEREEPSDFTHGDAGRRGAKKAKSPGKVFNDTVRKAIAGG